ncbi:cyclic nucleotide-gated cation channel alpha-3-like isoform X3 [Hydractinia symbiolongicarpus]|uniref:cyclic nucleotide-gated cation channel alpha-3-like isoform X3 n=1 Tax=Hydractinia symbiolongicarpus TaxID=13093 RepID=UPI002549C41F|nr:cyclic nucleotide-gated cation channel alpha-3-like isoform X3 [Hydractinia symbiolongicarpus]
MQTSEVLPLVSLTITKSDEKASNCLSNQSLRKTHLHADYSESLPSQLDRLNEKNIWVQPIRESHSDCFSSNWLGRNDWRNDSQKRWSMATHKIKNLLAVGDALNVSKRRSRAMSVEQKSNFLEKFSTRDRRCSGASFDTRRKDTTHLNDVFSHVSSTELRELYSELHESKTNVSNCGDFFQERRGCRLFQVLFEPYSTFIYAWSWVVIMAIHYNAWVIIFRIAFPEAQTVYPVLWFCLDYTADFIYLVDILIASRISFLENGIYVENVKRVMIKYCKSSKFFLDILSLLPLDILYIFYSVNPIFRLPRLIKFCRIFQAKKIVESMTNVPNLLRGVFWLHIMFLLMHWNSCFFFIISKYEGFGSNNWVYPRLVGEHKVLTHRYIKSMYWSTVVLTTIGESTAPQTTIECLYMIICYITGIFIFATIVGQAGNVIQNMNASRMEFEKQRDNTMQYMKGHNVPSHLQKRVRLWYDYTYSRGRFNGGDDINEVTMLPDKMKTELALHVHLETLRKVSFLQKCQPEFLHDLVLKMKLHIFTPGDFIVRKGEIAREMYVISDGIAEVVSDSGRVLKVLQPGDFFGEIGLLSLSAGQNRRTADVRSCGYIELFVLSKDDVMTSIRDYPDAQKILAKHGRKRLLLGSKFNNGPRNDTTSSSSDSEIELKITRPDSEISETYFTTNHVGEDEKVSTQISIDDIDHNTKDDLDAATPTYNFLTSPRNGFYLGTPRHSITSLKPVLRRNSSISSQHSNVIGPASSLKSLDNRLFSLQSRKKPKTHKLYSSDEEEGCMRLLPVKRNIRRSHSDMQRRRKRSAVTGSKRSVFSDSEHRASKNNQLKSLSSLSSIAVHDSTIVNKHFVERGNLDNEDQFLKSVQEIYSSMMQKLKQKMKAEVKQLERKLSELQTRNVEKQKDKEKFIEREEELVRELSKKETELYNATNEKKCQEQEFRMREENLRRKLEAMEKEMNEYRSVLHL